MPLGSFHAISSSCFALVWNESAHTCDACQGVPTPMHSRASRLSVNENWCRVACVSEVEGTGLL